MKRILKYVARLVLVLLATPIQTGLIIAEDIHISVITGNIEALTQQIDDGADINVLDSYNNTPLNIAVINTLPKIVALLLEKGASADSKVTFFNINRKRKEFCSCLYFSIRSYLFYSSGKNKDQYKTIIKALLKAGASPNLGHVMYNDTPLHLACVFNGDPELVKLLLKYKADPTFKANGDITPIQLAKYFGNAEIEQMLIEIGPEE